MNILCLTNLYPPHYLGGYELICWMAANGLRARGHSVAVLTSDHTIPEASREPDEPEVERRLKIHGFYGHPWRGIVSLARLESWNNRVLRQCVRRRAPDVVYVWNMGGLSKSMLFTLQRLGVPTAFYVSDHWIARGLKSDVWLRWWNEPGGPWAKRAVPKTLALAGIKKSRRLIPPIGPWDALAFPRLSFCSQALRSLTAAAGFLVGHGEIIHAPVDLNRFRADLETAGAHGERLLFVGRLSPDKGVMTALQAMARLRGKFSGALSVFGRGDRQYESELKQHAAAENLPVEFRSAPAAEMPRVYREHDVLIFPSEWEEPFALTPLEAMASGVPVIGTATGGSAELLRHNENALVFPSGQPALLAQAILLMAHDKQLRRRCALTAAAEVRQRFALPVIVDQIERLLLGANLGWPNARKNRSL